MIKTYGKRATCRSACMHFPGASMQLQLHHLKVNPNHSHACHQISLCPWCHATAWHFQDTRTRLSKPQQLWRHLEVPLQCCGYLRYLGIVRTMPTYLIWGTPALWGQCLRTLFEILRYCMDNAYVSSMTSRYLIWKSTLWLVHLWPTADVWLLQWVNYFSAMTAHGWTLAGKLNRFSEYYVRYFDTVRTVPTYLILSYHQIFDLESYVVTFVFAT